MKKITIKNKFKRTKLSEGRDFGIGFAVLDIINEKSFKTKQAFTACKDFLNDLVYVEHNNLSLAEIYGFKHKYSGFYKDSDFVYLGVKSLHYNDSPKLWKKFDEANKILTINNKNLLTVLNKLEDFLGLSKNRSTICGISDNTELVLKCPKFWFTRGYLVSLLTLFIRCFFNISEENSQKPLGEAIKNHSKFIFINADAYLYTNFSKVILIENPQEIFQKNYPNLDSSNNTIHNSGIEKFINYLK